MKTVWKFQLEVTDHQSLFMPVGAEVLTCGFQGNELFVWALVDDQAASEDRQFRIIGTGHEADCVQSWRYVNTVFYNTLVWHIFTEEQL
jgi:hypothetical protein